MTSPHQTTNTRFLTCREVLDFVMAYLEGELTPQHRHEFERHLSVCPSCVNYLDSYKATIKLGKAAMQNLDEPATGSVPEGLIRAVREARQKGASSHHDADS